MRMHMVYSDFFWDLGGRANLEKECGKPGKQSSHLIMVFFVSLPHSLQKNNRSNGQQNEPFPWAPWAP